MSTQLANLPPGSTPAAASHPTTTAAVQVTTLETARTAFSLLAALSDVLPGPANIVVSLGQEIITIINEIKTNKETCETIRDRTERLVLVVTIKQEQVKEEDLPQSVKDQMSGLSTKLSVIKKRLEDILPKTRKKGLCGVIRNIILRKEIASSLQKCVSDLDSEIEAFHVEAELDDAIQRATIAATIDVVKTGVQDLSIDVGVVRETIITSAERDRINQLARAKRASWRAQETARNCIDGTRVDLLANIDSWVKDSEAPRVFWAHGMAGAGKTTIAYSVAERADKKAILGASYFFSRDGEAELRDPSKVIPTIAHQLANFSKDFAKHIAQALSVDPDAAQSSRKDQCEKLIINPLRQVISGTIPVVLLVLDAFDECEETKAPELLRTLLDVSPRLPFLLKIFITSRPEPHIERILGHLAIVKPLNLNDVDDDTVFKDVRTYLQISLLEDDWRNQFSVPMPKEWISPDQLDELARKAGKLFIFASTCVLFIGDKAVRNPPRQLSIVLGFANATSARPYLTLDALYTKILENTMSEVDPEYIVGRFQAVMGTILTYEQTLKLPILDGLIGEPGSTSLALERLRSVVTVQRPAHIEATQGSIPAPPPLRSPNAPDIEFCHPSFPDYLRDPNRCTDKRFHIDIRQAHTYLARQCLKIVVSAIDEEAGGRTREVVMGSIASRPSGIHSHWVCQPALQYAEEYWHFHLRSGDSADEGLKDAYRSFCMLCLPDDCRVLSARLSDSAGENVSSLRPMSLDLLDLASPAFKIFLSAEEPGFWGFRALKITSIFVIEKKYKTGRERLAEPLTEVGAPRKMLWYAVFFGEDIPAISLGDLPMTRIKPTEASSDGASSKVHIFSTIPGALREALPVSSRFLTVRRWYPSWLVLCDVATGSTPFPPGSTEQGRFMGGECIASDPDDSQETPNEAGEGPELKELRSAVQRQSNKNEQPVVSDAAHICPKYLVLLAMSL